MFRRNSAAIMETSTLAAMHVSALELDGSLMGKDSHSCDGYAMP
jgi:hypothetical protein